MPGALVITAVGPGASVQDEGRFGVLRFGVTAAGPMDPAAMRTANVALGNAPGAAAIEIGPGGITLGVDATTTLAFAGGTFRWAGNEQPLPPTARVTLRPGEILRARAGAAGAFTYLAVPGGIDVAPVMGSRATHVRAGLGGFEGRALRAGDSLPIAGGATALDDAVLHAPWLARADAPIRVVLGPQDDYFAADAIAAFLDTAWAVTAAADRMAYKLDGPPLAHARDFNIVSDGVALGAVQIAGDGKPTVLMADRQPTGGYAKIAHVARADIGRLAQLRPGERLRFCAVTPDVARTALLALEDRVAAGAQLVPLRRAPTTDRLLSDNLIGGVTDGS